MLGWDWYGFDKKRVGTRYAQLVFLHRIGYACHVGNSGVSGPRNVEALFFTLGWGRCSFHKKRSKTRYVELVFIHLMGSAGHVVNSGAPGPLNIDAPYFVLGGD
jgi:hypothetical protein